MTNQELIKQTASYIQKLKDVKDRDTTIQLNVMFVDSYNIRMVETLHTITINRMFTSIKGFIEYCEKEFDYITNNKHLD